MIKDMKWPIAFMLLILGVFAMTVHCEPQHLDIGQDLNGQGGIRWRMR